MQKIRILNQITVVSVTLELYRIIIYILHNIKSKLEKTSIEYKK